MGRTRVEADAAHKCTVPFDTSPVSPSRTLASRRLSLSPSTHRVPPIPAGRKLRASTRPPLSAFHIRPPPLKTHVRVAPLSCRASDTKRGRCPAAVFAVCPSTEHTVPALWIPIPTRIGWSSPWTMQACYVQHCSSIAELSSVGIVAVLARIR